MKTKKPQKIIWIFVHDDGEYSVYTTRKNALEARRMFKKERVFGPFKYLLGKD